MKQARGKAVFLVMAMLLGSISFSACAEDTVNVSSLYKSKDVDASWNSADAEAIDLGKLTGDTLLISKKGDYVLTGDFQGQIVIEAPEEDKVRLILNGVSITSSQGPAIYEKQADKLIVTLAENTANTLTDGEAIVDGDDTVGAALYAEDDLSLNGSGMLIANGTAKHGIQSKADLIIAGGSIQVAAVLDGIRGRNSVLILDGNITVTTGGDGIASTRTDKEGKGWVTIADGTITIQAGEGAGETKTTAGSMGGNRGGWGRGGNSVLQSSSSDISQKAIKAATDLTVLGGQFDLNCADDGLHAVNVTVAGGTFLIRTGDDGMHADSEMTVNGGWIDIRQCYEGIEGSNVTITGGDIQIIASDDGVNAAGGNDASGFGGRGGDRFSAAGSGNQLTVTGGTLLVHAGGDGLDSNGSISITGGTACIWTATTQGDGTIDFNGTGVITGGLLILASTNGVMRDTASMTGFPLVNIPLSGTQSAGSELCISGENESMLADFFIQNAFDTLILAGENVQVGREITVSANGSVLFSGPITSDMTGVSSGSGFGNNGTRNRKGW